MDRTAPASSAMTTSTTERGGRKAISIRSSSVVIKGSLGCPSSGAIEAHLTIVFAALAVSRNLQEATSMSIKKLVQTLRTVRSATIKVNGQTLTLDPEIPHQPKNSSPRSATKVTKPRGTTQVWTNFSTSTSRWGFGQLLTAKAANTP